MVTEKKQNKKIFDIVSYGAEADGKTLCTQAVQAAIDACAEAGGGTVLFPQGDCVLSTVFLKDNVTICVPSGARVLGTLDFYQYNPDEKVDYPLYQDASHSFFECAMFVGLGCENIGLCGGGEIDMRSVWDEDNVRDIVHRGAKCISLKNCKNVKICDLSIDKATDLAVYFAGCEHVEVARLKLRVFIDGISPDCSKHVRIHDCEIESGDDAVVFKSSYTLNRIEICEDIRVWNCKLKSRCNAIKFGTETNGGFRDVHISDCEIRETRITGISVESVDGAVVDNLTFERITMQNVGSPLFVHLGKRLRGPEGLRIGKISNVRFSDIKATGPYVPYDIIPWNYNAFVRKNTRQAPWHWALQMYDGDDRAPQEPWQITSNICGLKGYPLHNIVLENIEWMLYGGAKSNTYTAAEEATVYPEVYAYGRILPAKGIYFRYIDGLTLKNVRIGTYMPDCRPAFVFESVDNLVASDIQDCNVE